MSFSPKKCSFLTLSSFASEKGDGPSAEIELSFTHCVFGSRFFLSFFLSRLRLPVDLGKLETFRVKAYLESDWVTNLQLNESPS